jgi:hypothetical protein
MDYVIAWLVYGLGGAGLTLVWFKLTGLIRHGGWRDLARGLAMVLIFTPGPTPGADVYAPAVVILLMGLIFDGVDASFASGIALLVASLVMLLVLIWRQFRRSRPVS